MVIFSTAQKGIKAVTLGILNSKKIKTDLNQKMLNFNIRLPAIKHVIQWIVLFTFRTTDRSCYRTYSLENCSDHQAESLSRHLARLKF